MVSIERLFPTLLYRAPIGGAAALLDEVEAVCRALAVDDEAGRRWSAANRYSGYTSYASLNDLAWRFPPFKRLTKALDRHAGGFARAAAFDLGSGTLALDSLWVNLLAPGGVHSGHIHPHSVISGTLYVALPAGAAALKIEDPRLPMMMAAPTRRRKADPSMRQFAYVEPTRGEVVLWESWLRHEVVRNDAREDRLSVSFNYRWDRS